MKKTVKILSVVLLVIMILASLGSVTMAATPGEGTGLTPSDFKGNPPDSTAINKVQDLGNNIIGIIRVVGTIVSVVILMILGIKYMTASAEGKADFKSALIPYLVGAILVFGATWVATAVWQLANGLQ